MIGKIIEWAVLGAIGIGIVVTVIVKFNFFKESFQELKKVTWPTKDEALNSAIVTVIFVVGFSLSLAFVDYLVHAVVMWLVK